MHQKPFFEKKAQSFRRNDEDRIKEHKETSKKRLPQNERGSLSFQEGKTFLHRCGFGSN
jgi:hypothetical protein